MGENPTQVKSGTKISHGVSVKILKKTINAKKAILGILLYVATKLVNMVNNLIDDSVIV